MKRSIKILLFALSLVVLLPALKAQHDPKQMGLNAITLEAVQGQLK